MEKNQSNPSEALVRWGDSRPKSIFTCGHCRRSWAKKTPDGAMEIYPWDELRLSNPFAKDRPDERFGECPQCSTKRRTESFQKICPSLYQKSETSRLPEAQLKKALEWQYGPRGLILLGDTGKGKSRVAWQLLKRLLITDKPERKIMWFDSTSFGLEIVKHYRHEDVDVWLEDAGTVPILFFDDLGKLKMTERAEVELFGLIERRCASELPIIVTTNDTGDTLAARMSDNRGPAMIRRLREFCEPVQF